MGMQQKRAFLDCCGCMTCPPVTLKSFRLSDGLLLWEKRHDNPVLSSDGHIYGYAYEEDNSVTARNCKLIRLSGAGAGAALRVAADSTLRYKKWVRKLSLAGAVVADSTFYWYTDNAGYTGTPIELPPTEIGWIPDCLGATAAGELLQMQDDNTNGTFVYGGEVLICWDAANTTAVRRYTIVAAAVLDLATPAANGTEMRFVAENDGTNAEQTIDVLNMIGKTAATLATDLEAFPHVVSATGISGTYPFENVEFEVEWAQTTYHFKSVQRRTSTSRSVRTWLRDWDTMEITAVVEQTDPINSTADLWQLDEDDEIIGYGTNSAASAAAAPGTGHAVERFTRAGFDYTQLWRTRPTEDRGCVWGSRIGSSRAEYTSPAIRNGVLIVGHDAARGNDQGAGEHSEWHQLDLTDGSLTLNGGTNDAWHHRPTFASDSQLLASGVNSYVTNSYTGVIYECEFAEPNYLSLTDALSLYVSDWFGAYGVVMRGGFGGCGACADTSAIFFCSELLPNGFAESTQYVLKTTDQTLMTVETRFTEGATSRVSPDGYFSLGNYYRVQHWFSNPVNARWVAAGMEWRVAFFNSDSITGSTAAPRFTAWLAFTADETDLQTALDTLLGSNDDGPNAFVEGPLFPVTASEPCDQMIWQRGIHITLPAEIATFPVPPPPTPPIPWNLNKRDDVRYCRIQVKAAVANEHFLSGNYLGRMDWDDGALVWNVPFGKAASGSADLGGHSGLLNGTESYVVAGPLVKGTC